MDHEDESTPADLLRIHPWVAALASLVTARNEQLVVRKGCDYKPDYWKSGQPT